jgi:hypothetical protein
VSTEEGQIFREAWINGVHRYYPGEPKSGYVTPWEETPDWERQAAAAVCEQVRQFVETSGGATAKLTREQRGQFVSLCWNAQIFRHFEDPKPSYVADWADLPEWQRQTDSDIFDAVESSAVSITADN